MWKISILSFGRFSTLENLIFFVCISGLALDLSTALWIELVNIHNVSKTEAWHILVMILFQEVFTINLEVSNM